MGRVSQPSAATSLPPAPPPAPVTPTVLLEDVGKSFNGLEALKGLSLAVPKGDITVLLGPNGAGKTTAIRIITGALPADRGLVQTFGVDPSIDGEQVRRRCGVVSAKPALYDRLPGWDNLEYAAALYGVTGNVRERIRAAAARFDIEDALDQYVGGYSTGMKTRLALSRAVLHDPDLLLLDEPTSGLDPESSHAVLDLIREMTGDGTTVIMCTHLLVEAEGLADQIIMLDDGVELLQGSQHDLIARYWPTTAIVMEAEEPATLDVVREVAGRDRLPPRRDRRHRGARRRAPRARRDRGRGHPRRPPHPRRAPSSDTRRAVLPGSTRAPRADRGATTGDDR